MVDNPSQTENFGFRMFVIINVLLSVYRLANAVDVLVKKYTEKGLTRFK